MTASPPLWLRTGSPVRVSTGHRQLHPHTHCCPLPYLLEHCIERLLAEHRWLMRHSAPHALLQRVHQVGQVLVAERVGDRRVL
eukprot:6782948-Prymnesium_polylepis.1